MMFFSLPVVTGHKDISQLSYHKSAINPVKSHKITEAYGPCCYVMNFLKQAPDPPLPKDATGQKHSGEGFYHQWNKDFTIKHRNLNMRFNHQT